MKKAMKKAMKIIMNSGKYPQSALLTGDETQVVLDRLRGVLKELKPRAESGVTALGYLSALCAIQGMNASREQYLEAFGALYDDVKTQLEGGLLS